MNDAAQTTRGSDRIATYFTDRILSGELNPGEKLPSEHDLCEQFAASRTVIRGAIQQLKARGAVNTLNGKGSYIAESRMDHFQDSLKLYSSRAGGVRDWGELLSMRSLIETECVRGLTAAGNQSKLDQIAQALEVMRKNLNDMEKFATADIEFHHVLVKAFGNKLFLAVWVSLQGLSLRFAHDTYRIKGQTQQNLEEHETIFNAMTAGQVNEASQAITNHLGNSRKNLEKMLG